jgi:hypothetical protein
MLDLVLDRARTKVAFKRMLLLVLIAVLCSPALLAESANSDFKRGESAAAQQAGEFGNLAGPRQFAEDGAQSDESADSGRGGQRRSLCTQAGHPSEDVRIAA